MLVRVFSLFGVRRKIWGPPWDSVTERAPLLPSGLLRGTGSLCGPPPVSPAPPAGTGRKNTATDFTRGLGVRARDPVVTFSVTESLLRCALHPGVHSPYLSTACLLGWLISFQESDNQRDLGTFPGVEDVCSVRDMALGSRWLGGGKTASEL